MKRSIERSEILQYALLGYQIQRGELERRIEELERHLNGAALTQVEEKKSKRRLSARGRAAIARATKERWRRAWAAGRNRLGK